MVIKEIQFCGGDCSLNDFNCRDGEIELAVGFSGNSDGSLAAGYSTKSVIRTGKWRPIAVHRGSLVLYAEEDEAEAPTIADIAELPEGMPGVDGLDVADGDCGFDTQEFTGAPPVCVESDGDRLFVGATTGLECFERDNGGMYHRIDNATRLPAIEFGVQQAGALSATTTIEVPEAVVRRPTGVAGVGASTTHPSAVTSAPDTRATSEAIATFYNRAVATQVEARGFFNRPFMLRYVLRAADATLLGVSPPVMMLPTVLPPCIGVGVSPGTDDGKSVMTVDMGACRYYRLRCRAAAPIDDELIRMAASVDVYVTAQEDTHVATDGYRTGYGGAVGERDSGERGRPVGSRSGESVFAGHYSVAGDVYADHYLEATALEREVWYMAPNPMLAERLLTAKDYHRVASIPVSRLASAVDFIDVPVGNTSASAIGAMPLLSPARLHASQLSPTAMTMLGGRLAVATAGVSPLPPPAFRAMAAYSGDASGTASTDVEITVHTAGGSATTTSKWWPVAPGENFPRYLAAGTADAYALTIRVGAEERHLALTPNDDAGIAYWFGGFGASTIPDSETVNPPATGTATAAVVVACDARCTTFTKPLFSLNTRVEALATASKTPADTVFGQYPLYAFTARGVSMLGYSAADNRVTGAQLISPIGCTSGESVSASPWGIYFADGDTLCRVSGAKVEKCALRLPAALPALPHIHRLGSISMPASGNGIKGTLPLGDEILIYRDNAMALLYNPATKTVCMQPFAVKHRIHGTTDYIYACDGVARICPGTDRQLLVTRAIKLASPMAPRDIAAVRVWASTPDAVEATALYAANRLDCWHAVASGKDTLVDVNAMPYRFARLAVVTRLTPGQYLHGAQITANDC